MRSRLERALRCSQENGIVASASAGTAASCQGIIADLDTGEVTVHTPHVRRTTICFHLFVDCRIHEMYEIGM